jgi:hypothetical protein
VSPVAGAERARSQPAHGGHVHRLRGGHRPLREPAKAPPLPALYPEVASPARSRRATAIPPGRALRGPTHALRGRLDCGPLPGPLRPAASDQGAAQASPELCVALFLGSAQGAIERPKRSAHPAGPDLGTTYRSIWPADSLNSRAVGHPFSLVRSATAGGSHLVAGSSCASKIAPGSPRKRHRSRRGEAR